MCHSWVRIHQLWGIPSAPGCCRHASGQGALDCPWSSQLVCDEKALSTSILLVENQIKFMHITSYHIISRSKQFFHRRFPQIPFYVFLHFLNSCQLFKTFLVGTSEVVPLHAMPQGTGVFAILDEECVAEPRWGTSSNAKAEDIETENISNFRNLN